MSRVLLGLLMLGLSSALLAADMARFYGRWQGQVTEIQGAGQTSHYEVVINIAPGRASVDYPGLGCRGELLLQRQGGIYLSFRDRLSHGADRCADNGRTELLWIDAGRLAFLWFDARGKLMVGGYLYRRQALAHRPGVGHEHG